MVLPHFKVVEPRSSARELWKGAAAAERRLSTTDEDGQRAQQPSPLGDDYVSRYRHDDSSMQLPSMSGTDTGTHGDGRLHLDQVATALVADVVKPRLLCGADQSHHITKWLRRRGRPEKHELNDLQLAQLKEAFEMMDIDNSGAIDVSELRSCFKLLGMKVSYSDAKEMLKAVDADGSGQIEYEEFLMLMTKAWATSGGKSEVAKVTDFQFAAATYRRTRLMSSIMTNNFDETHAMVLKCEGYREKELDMKKKAIDNAAKRFEQQIQRRQQRSSHRYGEYERRVEAHLLPARMREGDRPFLPSLGRACLRGPATGARSSWDLEDHPKPMYRDTVYRHLAGDRAGRHSEETWAVGEDRFDMEDVQLSTPEFLELSRHASKAGLLQPNDDGGKQEPSLSQDRVSEPAAESQSAGRLPPGDKDALARKASTKKEVKERKTNSVGIVMIPPAPRRAKGGGQPEGGGVGGPSKANPSGPRGYRRAPKGSRSSAAESPPPEHKPQPPRPQAMAEEEVPLGVQLLQDAAAGGQRVRHRPTNHVSPLAQQLRLEAEGQQHSPPRALRVPHPGGGAPGPPKQSAPARILLDATLPELAGGRQPAIPQDGAQPVKAAAGANQARWQQAPGGRAALEGEASHFRAAFPEGMDAAPVPAPAVPLPLFSSMPAGGMRHRFGPPPVVSSHSPEGAAPAVPDPVTVTIFVPAPVPSSPDVPTPAASSTTKLRSQKSVTGFGVGLLGDISAEDPGMLGAELSVARMSYASPRGAPSRPEIARVAATLL
eukprot:jgi/Tetstr1/420750/TSEL_011827.t1